MPLYGLIGYPLAHSFSQKYFTQKFANGNLHDCSYLNFEMENIAEIKNILSSRPSLEGLNVTIPHKTSVIPFLDEIDKTAAEINAVNTISIKNGKLKGYNTDIIGFVKSLQNFIGNKKVSALILGTGGSAKAVEYVLKKLGIDYLFVSRNASGPKAITYSALTEQIISQRTLLINCTPFGKFPHVNTFPPIDYNFITNRHFLFDLNYNPAQTEFLKHGMQKSAQVKNGYEMLTLQAEAAWEIWRIEGASE